MQQSGVDFWQLEQSERGLIQATLESTATSVAQAWQIIPGVGIFIYKIAESFNAPVTTFKMRRREDDIGKYIGRNAKCDDESSSDSGSGDTNSVKNEDDVTLGRSPDFDPTVKEIDLDSEWIAKTWCVGMCSLRRDKTVGQSAYQ